MRQPSSPPMLPKQGKSRTERLRQVGSGNDGIGYISDARAPARPMIPLSDENPTLHTPVMTWALLGAMFATWLAVQGAGFPMHCHVNHQSERRSTQRQSIWNAPSAEVGHGPY